MEEFEQLLDAKAVQKTLKCSLALVYKMSDEGRLPSVRIPQEGTGSRERYLVRFKPSDVKEFVERNYQRGKVTRS